ncbi:MAG: efflux RND transporter periplasmic adaptor subunit [Gemmatimonadaceae bacterium]
MIRSRRLVAPALALLVLLLLASTAYIRVRGRAEAAATDSARVGAKGEPVASASRSFGTDIAIPVEGAPVKRGTLVLSVTAAGQAAAYRQTTILAQVGGRVDRVFVRENSSVAAGTPLLAIDPAEYELAVAEASARLRQAEAQYRELTLFDDRIEDAAIRAERERGARAKSGIDAAEVALEKAQLDVQRARVTAPFAGQVASVKVVPGQYVRAGDELLTVADLNPIKVEVQVLESEVGYLSSGRAASVSFAAFPDQTFAGRIETINPLVDRDTRTAKVTVTVPNPQGRILPGMYARVSLDARRFGDRTLVPRRAILDRDRRTMLFVYEGDERGGLAKWRYVTTGLANDSLVEIVENPETEMVQPGETVLTDGHYSLIHDAKVRVVKDVRAAGGRPE